MNILITGATGQLGSKIVQHVLKYKTDEQIVVSVRDVEKALHLKQQGIEVRHGDFDDEQSLLTAFANIDRLVLVSTDGDTPTRIKQHRTAINAAKKMGVKLIVYTSITKADENEMNLAEVHQDTEKYLMDSGISYKILRNNWYLENELEAIKESIQTGIFSTAYGQGKVGWLLRDEFAQAAACAVLAKNEENKIYTLSNQLRTIDDLVNAVSKVVGKEIKVNHLSDATLIENLTGAGLPKGVIEFVVAMNKGIREGALSASSDDFEQLTGNPPQSLEDSLQILLNKK